MGDHHGELTGLLTDWLPRQRWFAGKGRAGGRLRIHRDILVSEPLRLLIIEVDYDRGPAEFYQVPLVLRHDAPHGHEGFLIGECAGGLVYDGLADPSGAATLLDFLARAVHRDDLVAERFPAPDDDTRVPLVDLPAAPIGAEQSNSSVVYGDAYILKVFRRLWPGENPDLEVTRALAAVGSQHVAAPVAWYTGEVTGVPTTFGFLQQYLRSGSEGWRMALASVRDLYAEADLRADEVGGDFAAEAERLGAATAQVHADLARALPTRPPTADDLRGLAAYLRGRLDAALDGVDALHPHAEAIRTVYDALHAAPPALVHPRPFQRLHGDLHLGQVLRVDSGWVLFDFEGEPARPVTDRVGLESPLRDVAGMLRSFDYAARSLQLERDDEPGLEYRAREWAQRNRDAFCQGYAATAGRDPRDDATMLRALELDKAVYEVLYEARHRPGWIRIPLAAVTRLTATAAPAAPAG
ncbi:aminoglycoside phosphotransferase [Frankia sp. AgPm24]|uniref:maltokinase N-terminal cap-like domain-containing protein n=1 Tax=Frankia sp. AgPm24 TaxID=631128 RepID=UPI002010466A|nr:aminoglycoside phosphotransferase [Frankia sp. AgPm24]MCK9924124.1 aminoglycoside phosphotransferase [Frankia sp. AgPm24]